VIQQCQVFELKRRSREGNPLWAFRSRIGAQFCRSRGRLSSRTKWLVMTVGCATSRSGADGDRTRGLVIRNHVLSLLSYRPVGLSRKIGQMGSKSALSSGSGSMGKDRRFAAGGEPPHLDEAATAVDACSKPVGAITRRRPLGDVEARRGRAGTPFSGPRFRSEGSIKGSIPAPRSSNCKKIRNRKSRFAALLQSPLTDSNRRPPPYHGGALPTELRGQARSL
jgi:hypothetical protein